MLICLYICIVHITSRIKLQKIFYKIERDSSVLGKLEFPGPSVAVLNTAISSIQSVSVYQGTPTVRLRRLLLEDNLLLKRDSVDAFRSSIALLWKSAQSM